MLIFTWIFINSILTFVFIIFSSFFFSGDYGQQIKYCGTDLPPDFYSLGQIVQVSLPSVLMLSPEYF